MAAETKSEHDSKELSEIRKEVIEARNLVIKTDNLLKNLHAEVKAIGKRHEDFQKRQCVSSGVAYVLFAALCVAGAVGVMSARGSAATTERERLEKNVAELSAQQDKQRGEQTATQASQRTANEVYRLMTTLPGDERLKGVDELVKLDTSRLTRWSAGAQGQGVASCGGRLATRRSSAARPPSGATTGRRPSRR